MAGGGRSGRLWSPAECPLRRISTVARRRSRSGRPRPPAQPCRGRDLVTHLAGAVVPVAIPCYRVLGCPPGQYRSWLVVRRDDRANGWPTSWRLPRQPPRLALRLDRTRPALACPPPRAPPRPGSAYRQPSRLARRGVRRRCGSGSDRRRHLRASGPRRSGARGRGPGAGGERDRPRTAYVTAAARPMAVRAALAAALAEAATDAGCHARAVAHR